MYAEDKKAIYVTLEASLLFLKKIQNLRINILPEEQIWLVCYEKKIKDKQYTIIWHFDNLTILLVDSNIVSSVISDIDVEYVNIAKMTITRGKIHKYLWMTIDYSLPGKLLFSMVIHIVNIIDDILEYNKRISATPAVHQLLILRKMQPKYPKQTQTFVSFCGASIVPAKASMHRHTVCIPIIVHYIEIYWYLLLHETVKCDEIYTSHYCNLIDYVNRQIWKYQVVRWCSICGAQLHEKTHWWFHDHGNGRGLCPIKKEKIGH